MKAIDIHAHIPRMPGIPEYGIEPGLRRMFRMNDEPDDIAKMVETYRAIDTMAVSFLVTGAVIFWTVPLGLFGLVRQGASLSELKGQARNTEGTGLEAD